VLLSLCIALPCSSPPPPHISLLTFTEDQDTRTTQKKALGSKRKALRCGKVVSCFYLGLIAAVLPANHTPMYCPHFLETHFLVELTYLTRQNLKKGQAMVLPSNPIRKETRTYENQKR